MFKFIVTYIWCLIIVFDIFSSPSNRSWILISVSRHLRACDLWVKYQLGQENETLTVLYMKHSHNHHLFKQKRYVIAIILIKYSQHWVLSPSHFSPSNLSLFLNVSNKYNVMVQILLRKFYRLKWLNSDIYHYQWSNCLEFHGCVGELASFFPLL